MVYVFGGKDLGDFVEIGVDVVVDYDIVVVVLVVDFGVGVFYVGVDYCGVVCVVVGEVVV